MSKAQLVVIPRPFIVDPLVIRRRTRAADAALDVQRFGRGGLILALWELAGAVAR